MSYPGEEPKIEGMAFGLDAKSSVKFVRNARGETQIEVKAVDGATENSMDELRRIAFSTYKAAVEAAGGRLPEPA